MIPAKLGKYPITGVIGEGAMGVVYRGLDPVIGRPVAIKTLHRQLAHSDGPDSSFAARFRNEAQAVGRLSHPGIVAIYEYGEDGGTAFIAMEYVEGRTLSQLLATTPLPNEPTIVRVMEQLLDALDCAHAAGVWHRDIKPANIIVTARGQLKVTDFGIARIDSNALTLVTSIIGTPGYIAPEQYIGLPLDHRIDIFAAGVLLYRMLTGNSPFAGSPEAVMYKTVNEHPPAPSEATGGKRSAGFDAVVARALAKRPDERYPSAAVFRQDLLQVLRARQPSADSADTAPAAPPTAPQPDALAPTLIERHAGSSTPADTTPSGGTLLAATSIAGWDARALAPVERALASVIGPMAKLMVRQAARTSPDLDSLTARVADSLPDAGERAAFLAHAASLARAPAAATATPAASTTPPLTDPGGPLPSGVIHHALRVLTAYMGPMARIVIKQAAAQSHSVDDFYIRVADDAADGVDRKRLLKRLRARMQ